MPLQKLWKSFFGGAEPQDARSAQKASADHGFQSDLPDHTSSRQSVEGKGPKLARCDKRLLQRIDAIEIRSVLEVGINDPVRSISVARSIVEGHSQNQVSYLAIDQFEMGGGELKLREFHKQIREVGVVAQLIPMSTEAGLDKVLRTVGQVDIILWNAGEETVEASIPKIIRLSTPSTLMFISSADGWSETRSSLMASSDQSAA